MSLLFAIRFYSITMNGSKTVNFQRIVDQQFPDEWIRRGIPARFSDTNRLDLFFKDWLKMLYTDVLSIKH